MSKQLKNLIAGEIRKRLEGVNDAFDAMRKGTVARSVIVFE